jgi:histidinol-phosphatase (PHP family)
VVRVLLPADSHVHTEWSWDAPLGSMVRTCERAVQLGLPSVAFTEHVDHTVWNVDPSAIGGDDEYLASLADDAGRITPPRFDAAGYLESLDRCRHQFPGLRILRGLELGEPHWHATAVADVLAVGEFDRVLGSLHCLPDGDGYAEPPASTGTGTGMRLSAATWPR